MPKCVHYRSVAGGREGNGARHLTLDSRFLWRRCGPADASAPDIYTEDHGVL